MMITEKMKLERALKHLEAEEQAEEAALEKLEGISLTDVIIVRNKKMIYIAELKQRIRIIRERIAGAEVAS